MCLTTAREKYYEENIVTITKNETLDQVAWETATYPSIKSAKNSDKHL